MEILYIGVVRSALVQDDWEPGDATCNYHMFEIWKNTEAEIKISAILEMWLPGGGRIIYTLNTGGWGKF
jgi:hypothetical protein